jgi:hypothetical protein
MREELNTSASGNVASEMKAHFIWVGIHGAETGMPALSFGE